MRNIRNIFIFICCTSAIIGCNSNFNIKTELNNYKKAENIFENYYNKNGNAFLYSIGTIGNKYIWSYFDNERVELTIVKLTGKKEIKEIINVKNWTNIIESNIENLPCPLVLDGDIIKFKFRNLKNKVFENTLAQDFECLEKNKEIENIIKDIEMLKIK